MYNPGILSVEASDRRIWEQIPVGRHVETKYAYHNLYTNCVLNTDKCTHILLKHHFISLQNV